MKKLVLFSVATVMILMVASAAFATTNSGYATWTTGGANSGSDPTPHKDFQLTTVKCAVCHAVHKGDPDGQLLLQGTVSNAGSCVYCHVTNAIGNIKIYGGDINGYSNPSGATSHTRGICTECHAVHGANTWTAPSSVSVKILRTSWDGESYETTAYDALYAGGTDHNGTVTIFCTMCHAYFQQESSGLVQNPGGTTYQSHVMTSNVTALTADGGATFNGKVAWKQSLYCRDCHDAGGTNESVSLALGSTTWNNFPHYTRNNARFMMAAGSVASLSVNTSAALGGLEADAEKDGACLKCHKGDAVTGVGETY